MTGFKKPPPLEIQCTSSDCKSDLHCFKAHRSMAPDERGKCRSCGADLVNWDRLHRRDRSDIEHTFIALQKELIRHHFWHAEIDEKAVRHAQRKGMIKLVEAVENRIRKSIGVEQPYRDGRQTPFEGNSIYYAQHAVACCCRTCLEYWHDVPKGRALTDKEIAYCTELVIRYLKERLPGLPDEPQKVPRRLPEKTATYLRAHP